MTTTTLQGDNTAILPTLGPGSVQCIVTSPPYYGLRDYGIPPTAWPEIEYTPMAGLPPVVVPPTTCCLGLEADPLAYVAHLVHVWRMLWFVLRGDGVCWLNLGDSYTSNGGHADTASNDRRAQYNIGNRPEHNQRDFRARGPKPKDLLGIPWRVAYALQADGWYLRSDVIWHKPNPMPESVQDRPTKAHEYLFLLTKSERYYYDAAAIAEPSTTNDARRPYTSAGAWALDGRPDEQRHGGKPRDSADAGTTRNRRSVWTIATQPYSGAHFAVMPEALIEPCILAGSLRRGDYEPDGIISTPIGEGERESDPSFVTGRAGFNRPRRASEATQPISRAEQRAYAEQLRGSPHKDDMAGEAGPAFDHYTRTDTTGARPVPPALLDAWIDRGWLERVEIPPRPAEPGRSVVLDPYGGSGTVGRVAERLQRDAVLIELNSAYVELQEKRLDGAQVELFV